MTTWSLTTCSIDDAAEVPAIIRKDGTIVVPDILRPYDGLKAALADWDQLAPRLSTIDVDQLAPVTGARVGAPVRYPSKLICVAPTTSTTSPRWKVPWYPMAGSRSSFWFHPPRR